MLIDEVIVYLPYKEGIVNLLQATNDRLWESMASGFDRPVVQLLLFTSPEREELEGHMFRGPISLSTSPLTVSKILLTYQ